MKNSLLLIALAGIAFTACKKDRTCTCTNTILSKSSTQPNYTYTIPAPTTNTTKYTNIKKNSVYAQMCTSQEITQTSNQSSFSGTVVTNYVVTTVSMNECELK